MVAGAVLWFGYEPLLRAMGQYLVLAEPPSKADLIIVLGGDLSGTRAMKGCQLLKQGYAGELWLSGLPAIYGIAEGDLAREFVRKHDCVDDRITPIRERVDSTRDEAISLARMMTQRGVKRILLVTSNFHTRRAGNTFRQYTSGVEIVTVSGDEVEFPVDGWWKYRHSRRTFVYEWLKTVSYWMGL